MLVQAAHVEFRVSKSIEACYLGFTHHPLQSKAFARMPPNVAVHQPGAWVVRLGRPARDSPRPGAWQHRGEGVVRVERHTVAVGACALRQDVEVEAVQVDRMCHAQGRADDQVDPLVGVGQRDDCVGCARSWSRPRTPAAV